MSIKKKTVAICDICGFTVDAKKIGSQYNETIYGVPDGWEKAKANAKMHLCPDCVRKVMEGVAHEAE